MNQIPVELSDAIARAGRIAFGEPWRAETCVAAPGRIEVIGNHVDYNGGPVLAAAIDRHVAIGVARNTDSGAIRVVFTEVGDSKPQRVALPVPVDWRSDRREPQPIDYLFGAIAALERRGISTRSGLDLVVAGNLPFGIGISSSAALCVALVHAMAADLPEKTDVILAAQEAEHRVGSPCGTMDQSASVYGGLIRFDGSPNDVRPVAAELAGLRFVVVNSGVVRSLATSSYPVRVRETTDALAILQRVWRSDLTSLASIEPAQLEVAIGTLESAGESILAKRVRHVVTECRRVRDAEVAISQSDWERVGELMTESGHSSAMDYDVSHPRVEEVAALARQQAGVLGARMMGGGEGGSALVLVREDAIPDLQGRLDRDYFAALGAEAPALRSFTCRFASGAGEMALSQAS